MYVCMYQSKVLTKPHTGKEKPDRSTTTGGTKPSYTYVCLCIHIYVYLDRWTARQIDRYVHTQFV